MGSDLDRVLAGRFRIDSLLGEGGMGSVYAATDLSIGRKVAIKLLRRELAEDPTSLQRMREEAVALASLHHPNVVQLYDFQAGSPETTFLLMELVHGESLATRLARTHHVPIATAVDYGCQLLSALSAAHGAGIIHRDIKPANVLVTPLPGNRELLKVLDFGIAKLTEETIRRRPTTAGILLGTPSAMSPEQASGRPVDTRSDIYAAGLLIYTLVTGKNPFKGVDLVDTLRRVNDTIATPISEVRPDVPRELSDIVARAMAKDPNHRFQSAIEFERTLQSFAARMATAPASHAPHAVAQAMTTLSQHAQTAAPSARTPKSTSGPLLAVVGVTGAALAVGIGALAFVALTRTAAPTVQNAVLDAAVNAAVVTPAASLATSPSTPTAIVAAASTRSPARVAGKPGPSGAVLPTTSTAATGPVVADAPATAATCRCVPNMQTAIETGHGGNQALGLKVVPLECRCNEPERLCPLEIIKCTAGSPGCQSPGFTQCKNDVVLAPKQGTPCSGWNSNGVRKQGTLDCNFPSSVTHYVGPEGNRCTGFTNTLKAVVGSVRCP